MSPDELHDLWVDAGRPVCIGMILEEGCNVTGFVHDDRGDHIGVTTSFLELVTLMGSPWQQPAELRIERVRPNFTAPTTEHLLMHLAEVACGHHIQWEWDPDDPATIWRRGALDCIGTARTRTELALRIIAKRKETP